jgi:hypothetical protein
LAWRVRLLRLMRPGDSSTVPSRDRALPAWLPAVQRGTLPLWPTLDVDAW